MCVPRGQGDGEVWPRFFVQRVLAEGVDQGQGSYLGVNVGVSCLLRLLMMLLFCACLCLCFWC